MFHFFYDQQKKQGTFVRHWLWSIFALSLIVDKKCWQGIILFTHRQKKPCFNGDWIQKNRSKKDSIIKKKKDFGIYVDETAIKVGSELIWLWVAIEPKNMEILALNISNERNMFIAECFLSGVVKEQKSSMTTFHVS